MKIYISADIEGVAGIMHWNEALPSHPDYKRFSEQMTREVAAACEGAISAGAAEVWVKDAHDEGRNLIHDELPGNVKLIRGFSGHPFGMMQELDETFAAVLLVGYHSYAGSGGSPLAHTLTGRIHKIRLNDTASSEFLLNTYAACSVGVPVVFVSGDEEICLHAEGIVGGIATVATKRGRGGSVICEHPRKVCQEIKDRVASVLSKDFSACRCKLPAEYRIEIEYKEQAKAYRASFYPGVKQISPTTVGFSGGDYLEARRMISLLSSI